MKTREWLETDGLGGFASGTVDGAPGGLRTRRYHGLLVAAATPPTGRFMLASGFDAWVQTPRGRFAITSQRYAPDVVHPAGDFRIESFRSEPWPRWRLALPDGTRIDQEIFMGHGAPVTAVSWALPIGGEGVRLFVRPLLCGRDSHALHRENPDFQFTPTWQNGHLTWQPYPGVPAVGIATNGTYRHEPCWYRNFLYPEEIERGFEGVEDLASPGELAFDLSAAPAVCMLRADPGAAPLPGAHDASALLEDLRSTELERRRAFPSPLQRAADAYIAQRGRGRTIIAGYPWFTDWGRDTFIALRGLCLASGRLDVAREILLAWAGSISQGMVPNRFADQGEAPEFNSVDASLWYVIAVHEFLEAAETSGLEVSAADRGPLRDTVLSILAGYTAGTRFGIRADDDGLLAAGESGQQLTWMDARVGDRVITPRIGKPVEVQALWLNALRAGSELSRTWREPFERGVRSFRERFWNESEACLFDVVDAEHERGRTDAAVRPNQIFAVGGLPWAILENDKARSVVDVVERRLLTPLGLRSLAPGHRDYRGRYEGGPAERDGAYHQGTVWPWLMGPFVEAWVRVRGGSAEARRVARQRFLGPLLDHLPEAGVGHVSEIADAEAPHTPRGCPFQAWSLGELLRLDLGVLASAEAPGHGRARPLEVAR